MKTTKMLAIEKWMKENDDFVNQVSVAALYFFPKGEYTFETFKDDFVKSGYDKNALSFSLLDLYKSIITTETAD